MVEAPVCRLLHGCFMDAQTSLKHLRVQVYIENEEAEVQEAEQLRRMAVNSGANPDGFFDLLASTRVSCERKSMCIHPHVHTLTCTQSCIQMKTHRHMQAPICTYTHTGNLKSTRWEPHSWSES